MTTSITALSHIAVSMLFNFETLAGVLEGHDDDDDGGEDEEDHDDYDYDDINNSVTLFACLHNTGKVIVIAISSVVTMMSHEETFPQA